MSDISRRNLMIAAMAAATTTAMATGSQGAEKNAKAPEIKGKPAMIPQREFTTSNSIIMLVDHQTGTVNWVKSLPKETVISSCRVLTRMALDYRMPLVLTTTMEENVGPTIKDIQDLAPDAFAKRYKRGGQLSCWDDEALQAGVRSLGKKNIIVAGLTTDICLYWAASDALKLGYRVLVVADACGTTSTLGDQLTHDRLRQEGAVLTVVNQAVTELANNFGTAEGQKAQKIMGDEIISKL